MNNTATPDTTATPPDSTPQPANARRLKRELQWAGGSLAFGLTLLPAAIYAVGTSLLGPYDAVSGGAAHIGSFYGDVFRGLAAPTLSAWSIAVGPMIIVTLLRLILLPWPSAETVAPTQSPPVSTEPVRREPFVGN